ncbi:hypothetical protein BS78_K324800 [Paspalum vaginatum]|uniref:Uncharacterized protein n=1 Tax=Paspalum vaginatum TaxID=158149 RepID=A0A9W7X9F9_9POAL|nr:hypothetical protein BS78_K324800 [Paspalum vaginatum]
MLIYSFICRSKTYCDLTCLSILLIIQSFLIIPCSLKYFFFSRHWGRIACPGFGAFSSFECHLPARNRPAAVPACPHPTGTPQALLLDLHRSRNRSSQPDHKWCDQQGCWISSMVQ